MDISRLFAYIFSKSENPTQTVIDLLWLNLINGQYEHMVWVRVVGSFSAFFSVLFFLWLVYLDLLSKHRVREAA